MDQDKKQTKIQCEYCGNFFTPPKISHSYCGLCYVQWIHPSLKVSVYK
uniref:Uncharacterized protein n=1 Tax=viral metagenome TaxID=1070528 RepID=A0A6C0KSM2_9ZZZZ